MWGFCIREKRLCKGVNKPCLWLLLWESHSVCPQKHRPLTRQKGLMDDWLPARILELNLERSGMIIAKMYGALPTARYWSENVRQIVFSNSHQSAPKHVLMSSPLLQMTDKRDFAQQRRGLWGLALCTVVKMEWINMKVQQINGTEHSSTPRWNKRDE